VKNSSTEDNRNNPKAFSRRFLYLTVFAAGMTTLAVEFTTSRMLQTVYGTSNIVWANVIGLVLLFLTLGYFVGGWLADKHPDPGYFYWIVTAAGFASSASLLLASVILREAASAMAAINVGAIISSLVAVLFTLAIPVTLLGSVSPFAIRLAVRDVSEAGRISGRIYAVSTWGSLLGTYLPVLIIIPIAGTRIAALIFGTLLLIIGIYGLWQNKRQHALLSLLFLLVLIPLAVVWTRGGIKDYSGQLFEEESAYNYIQVIRRDDCNYLLLNEGQAYHSFYCDDGAVPRISVWSLMLSAPYFNDPSMEIEVKKMVVIGLAAGTIAKQFSQVFGPIAIDGIELDPAIVQIGRDYFAMEEPNINIIIGDGRYELNRLEDKYDIITLDAYKVPYIPWHLTTQEFFLEVKEHLSETGVLAINVGNVPDDPRLVQAITATLLTVFPSVHTLDVPGSFNSIIVATNQPTLTQNIIQNANQLPENSDPLLLKALGAAVDNLAPTESSDIVFTDERAPVETIIDSMVIRYLLRRGPVSLPGIEG
jgi:spermidine synthase